MRNFLNLLISVFGAGIAPIVIIFALFQEETKEGKRKGRVAILIGFALAFFISILIYFVPAIDIFSNYITEMWIGSLLHTFFWFIILLLSLASIVLKLKKRRPSIKTILLVGGVTLILIHLILFMSFNSTFTP